MSPVIEWWVENFSLVSDFVTRRYPFYMVAYESVLDHREETLRSVFGWLGDGDVDAAIQHVEPALRTQDGANDDQISDDGQGIETEAIEVFDALYDVVLRQAPLDQAFVDHLNAVNELLQPRIREAIKQVAQAQLERRRFIEERRASKTHLQ
jgi:hypothetical protein